MPELFLTALMALAASTAPPPPAQTPASAAQVPSANFQAMTLKLDHDEGGEHMCPANGQLASFQANASLDDAPVVVELLGPDRKALGEKAWSPVAGLRMLPLVQGPIRITMICSVR